MPVRRRGSGSCSHSGSDRRKRQSSDELFGGYAKFEELALKEELDTVDLAMWNSVLAAAEGDFEPGDKVAVSFGLELRCPFAFLPLVNSALQLPVGLKVKMSQNG